MTIKKRYLVLLVIVAFVIGGTVAGAMMGNPDSQLIYQDTSPTKETVSVWEVYKKGLLASVAIVLFLLLGKFIHDKRGVKEDEI